VAGLFALVATSSARGEVLLIAPDGPPVLGATAELLVVLHQDGVPLVESPPTLTAERGRVSAEGVQAPGVYGYRYRAPTVGSANVSFTIGTGSGAVVKATLALAERPESGFTLHTDRLSMRAGSTGTVSFELHGDDLPTPKDVVTAVSEGAVEGVYEMKDGLLIKYRPGAERFPRVALVGVRDDRRVGAPPIWVPIRLVGHPRIPVETEPGAVVRMEIRGRSYGPYTTDESGQAVATPDVYPGERAAAVSIEDPNGNRQSMTLTLGGEAHPTLVGVADRYGISPLSPPVVHLAAVTDGGADWQGEAPRCRLSPGGIVPLILTAPGRFELRGFEPEGEDFLDLRVDCDLDGGNAKWQARLPVGRGVPRRVQLRVYPDALSADFPVAQVQAVLEDRLGERLSPQGVTLSAELGEIRFEPQDGLAIAGEYNGAAAAGVGHDQVRVRFTLPPGSGEPVRFELGVGQIDSERLTYTVVSRALGRDGLPVEGALLRVSADERGAEVKTDAEGWAAAEFPLEDGKGLYWLSVSAGEQIRRVPFFPSNPGDLVDAGRADLVAVRNVRITAGRIREVFLVAEPSQIDAVPGAFSRIVVKLVDRSGQVVRDESLTITASTGDVSSVQSQSDGSVTATLRPPAGMQTGSIKVSAAAQDGAIAASTDVTVVPRPYRRAIGLGVGGVTNLAGIGSPWLQVDYDFKVPKLPEQMLLRASLATYSDARTLEDTSTGADVSVTTRLAPLFLGALLREEERARSLWVGTGLAALLYQMNVQFGDDPTERGMGIGGPGVVFMVGAGARVGGGELGVEVRYLIASTPPGALTFVGGVGGLSISSGYRVVF